MDTEDKQAWCTYGEEKEDSFVKTRLSELGLAGFTNPAKKLDKYTHDLFVSFQADLKTVRTPLFKAHKLYGIDPQYAVTFNHKDVERYKQLYPNIIVIFDVMWEQLSKEIGGVVYTVKPMHITAAGFIHDIRRAVIRSGSKTINYARRVDDTQGNAKLSWVFDVRDLQIIS